MTIWSTHREVAVSIIGVFALVALAAVMMYMAGVQFVSLNNLDPQQVRITSILEYWRWYADDPQQRERLHDAILMAASQVFFLTLGVVLAVMLKPWRRLRMARFASTAEIKHAGLLDFGDDPRVIIGEYKGEHLSLRGHQSVMLFAPPRGGNTRGMVIPSVLTWTDSLVVLDIDGKNFDVTAGFRASSQPVFAFSPFDERERSHCWNPLLAVREGQEHRKADLLVIAEVFFPSVGQESSDAFYFRIARELFVGAGLMLFESPELPRTIAEMLRQASCPQRLLGKLLRRRSKEGAPACPELAATIARELLNPQGFLAHVVATFKAALSIFGETSVDAATSGDDFRLEDVRRQRMSIYVRMPARHLDSAKPLLNLFFSQLVALNTRLAPAKDPALKYQCLFVNDEFTVMGRVDAIVSKVHVLGDYNLTLLTILQEMSQLDAVYGWQAARSFAASHAARVFHGPLLQGDSEDYSFMVGHRSRGVMSSRWVRSASRSLRSFFSRRERQLHQPSLHSQEFEELDDEQLVLVTQNCVPVLAHKIRYQSDEVLRRRLRPPPEIPHLDMRRHMVRVQRRVRDMQSHVGKPASPPAPSPAVRTTDSPLVRDLSGLASRLERSLDNSEVTRTGRRNAEDEVWTRD